MRDVAAVREEDEGEKSRVVVDMCARAVTENILNQHPAVCRSGTRVNPGRNGLIQSNAKVCAYPLCKICGHGMHRFLWRNCIHLPLYYVCGYHWLGSPVFGQGELWM